MKQRTWKKTAAFVLALMLVAAPLSQAGGEGGFFEGTAIVASAADNISYRKWNDTLNTFETATCASATEITATSSTLSNGWYVVNTDVVISSTTYISGEVNLILCDGCTLTAQGGIILRDNSSLTIYGQNGGMGKLNAMGQEYCAGIGGGYQGNGGTVTIHGGIVTATGGGGSAGIGGGFRGNGGTVTIYGGTVTATGGEGGAGIGSGFRGGVDTGTGGTVKICGGTVVATGGAGGAGIGGGTYGAGADVTITGGDITATGVHEVENFPIPNGIGKGDGWPAVGTLTMTGMLAEVDGMLCSNYPSDRGISVHIWKHTHNITYSVSGNTITGTCTETGTKCNLNPKTISLSISAGNASYDGATHGATLSYNVNSAHGNDAQSEFNEAAGTSLSDSSIVYYLGATKLNGAPTNAGNYTAKIAVGGVTASVDYEIKKAVFSPAAVTALSATYGQTLADVALPTVTDGKWAWKDPTTSVGNAGGHEFTAVFTPTSANYSAVERTITVNVAKAEPIYSDFRFTAPSNLTYDSNAKTANVTFNTQNGQYSGMGNITVKYFSDAACNTEVTPSDVKNAGTYYVGITVADNGTNYNASTGVITSDSWKFVIAKANITPSVSIEGWTYDETAKTPSLGQNSNPGNGDVTYEYKKQVEDDSAYSENVPTNAGNYTVRATIAQTTNYNVGTATANFTINKADYSHSIKPTVKTNVIFNNEEQTLFVNPETLPEGATIEYRDFSNKTSAQMMISAFENGTNWSSEIPKATESGIYTYAYRIKGDSNHNSYPVTADLSEDNVGGFVLMGQINKAAPTYNAPVLQGTRLTHYSSDLLLIKTAGSVTDGQGTMFYAVTEDNVAPDANAAEIWKTGISDIKATKAGTYYVWYKITGNNNYELAPAKADEVKVTQYTAPSKSSQTWTLTMDSYAYDGTAHTPTINGTTRGTVTYTYYNADTDEELDEAPSAVGNYKVKVYASGNNAYNSKSLIKTYSITDPIDKNGMANVDAFKANGTVPASDGKIFAGWFTDETCTKAFTEKTGKAYAKFIDEKILTVKAQISSGTTASSASTSIRFITSVDSLKYQNVGFKITCNGKTIDRKMTKVYTAINAGGAKVKPTVFSEDSRYMEAYTLNNITKDDYGKAFTVTPYYTTQDGTIVEGATNTFTIANMIK